MTTYTGDFELRKLLIRIARTPAGGTVEDNDWCSWHFAKVTGGAVDSAWVAGDYTTIETAFDTLWSFLKAYLPATMQLGEYRWFKDGPAWSPADRAPGPPNPAVRSTLRAVAGTNASGVFLPPQTAITVSKLTAIRKRWGRVYWPGGDTGSCDAAGRIAGSRQDDIAARHVTWLNACRAASKFPVIWSRERSAYVTAGGQSIPFHAASAYTVDTIQVDNLFDELRSRRYGGPTRRTTTALT